MSPLRLRHAAPLDWTRPGPHVEPNRPPGPVDVIVPVYGAAAELAACLQSLLRTRISAGTASSW